MIPSRPFGTTGLSVSALGLGAGPLGEGRVSGAEAARLIDAALDLGLTLIDTARSYGASEERIGAALGGRRARVVLATKVGYGVVGVADWTAEAVRRGIDEALGKLRTDWIDIVHLHSCPEETLQRGEVQGALGAAVAAGKVRVAAYSGENAALDRAALSDHFRSIELSVNPWDQGAIDRILWRAKERGLGVIAKRPLANAFWSAGAGRPDLAAYQERGRRLALPGFDLAPEELAIRFAAFTWGVDSAIAGTTRIEHLRALALAVERGPLPTAVAQAVREAWWREGAGWPGII